MIALFARHPTAANLMMVLMIAVGLVSLPQLQRATFPDFDTASVAVTIAYPGASATEGEEAICLPIEEALEGLVDLEELRCAAREGAVTATAEMRDGGDLVRFVANVRTEIDAIDSFPDLAETPLIREQNLFDRVFSVAVAGPMSERDLKRYAEDLKTRILRETTARTVEIQGFAEPQIRIALDPAILRRFGLDLTQVADIVRRQSLDLPTGSIETEGQDLLVRLADKRRTAESFRELVIIGGEAGGEVRLGQLALVTEAFDDPAIRIELDGERAAVLQIDKTEDQDTLRVMASVQAFLDTERAAAPPGVRYVITRDSSSIVQDRLDLLTENGAYGLVLVFLVMSAFFSFRFAFWVAMALPATFLAAAAAMVAIGYSINMITMVALLIAIGIIMDDSIVIAENIAAKLQAGAAPVDAAIEGARQVVPSVMASFATSICVFLPLAFLEGNIGKVLTAVPVVLIIVLCFSLIEAFFILPHHIAGALSQGEPSRFHRWFQGRFDTFRDRLMGPFVDRCVEWRYLVLGIAFGAFLAALGLVVGGVVGFRAFPDLEGDTIEARVLMPQGTPLAHTERAVAQILDGLDVLDAETRATHPDERSLVRARFVRYGTNADVTEQGAHLASVVVDLIPNAERHVSVPELLNQWRDAVGPVPEATVVAYKEPIIGPGGRALEIEISGDDLGALEQAADVLQSWFAQFPGVADLQHDLRPGKPEIQLALRQGARGLGLDSRMLAQQVRAALTGEEATELQIDRETIEVNVELSQSGLSTLQDLDTFPILLADGRTVPLGSIATFTWGQGLAQINRVDGVRVVTLTGDFDRERIDVEGLFARAAAEIVPELEVRFPGVAVDFEGERAEQQETGDSMRRAFLIGLLAMFVLLSFLFASYAEPIIVLLAIPMAAIGAILGHLVMGLDLSMPSVLGLSALAGIVVNDSILLVNFVKLRAAELGDVVAAAKQASRDRLRAVLLTSLTTIAGVTPILFETSLQAQVLIPLVTSIAFGLMASTVLVLVVIPCAFAVLHDLGLASTARRPSLAEPPPHAAS